MSRRVRPLRERFEERIQPEPMSGCHLWTGSTNKCYGVVGKGGRSGGMFQAHRLSWEFSNGPIPDGLHVLHKCDTPACVNPDHLFLGTNGDNIRDAIAKGRQYQVAKTHCVNGHAFTPENTAFLRGNRQCRACHNVSNRRYRASLRTEAQP